MRPPTLFIGAVLLAALWPAVSRGADEPRILTQVAEVRALSRVEAAKGLTVRLRGVVAWRSEAPRGPFIIHDATAGIWVDTSMAEKRSIWAGGETPRQENEVGALLEIEGVSDPGGYAPVIVPTRFHRVGSATLPEARRVSMERMLSGAEDAQRIEVDGVVQAVSSVASSGAATLSLIVEGRPCAVIVERGREIDPAALVDARVRVRGAFTPLPNLRAQIVSLKLNATGREDIDILDAPPRDPFLAPRVALNELLPFSPSAIPFHRKVTEGVVTFASPGKFFFLEKDAVAVRVETKATEISAGDRVEVAGFIDTSGLLASMSGALVRKLGTAAPPPPAKVNADQLLHPAFRAPWEKVAESDFSSRLVRLSGRIRRLEPRGNDGSLVLQIESDRRLFPAILASGDSDEARKAMQILEGADVEVTGICELNFQKDPPIRTAISIVGFSLWLRSPGDIRVVHLPSWWTPRRLSTALASVGGILLIALGWNVILQRTLRRRTQRFEQVMQAHRNVELEFNSARRERMRLAADLHDGMKQLLATASFRMDAAARHLPESAGPAAQNLTAAHQVLGRAQTELQECLWGLNAVEEGPPELVQLLEHVTANVEEWPAHATFIHSEGTPRHLSRDLAGNLLLLFQEAVGNAYRHGHANHVEVTVTYGEEALDLCIADDGIGFNPASAPGIRDGHFGIEGMKKRMQWHRGTLTIHQRHGGGMEVRARIPWSAMSDAEARDQATPPPL